MIRGPPPATLPTGPPGLPGPSGLPAGPPAVGPAPVPPPSTPSTELKKKHLSSPPRFRGFFPGATPPSIPTAPSSSVNNATLPQTLGPSPKDLPRRWLKGGRSLWRT